MGLYELQLLVDTIRGRTAPPQTAAVPAPARAVPEGAPLLGEMTSDFGWRIFRGRPEYHTGIDISAPHGTPVLASAAGTVVGSGWQPSYGWCVLIQHPGGYHTLFAHLSERRVKNGDVVQRGDVIGHTGSSGRSTGPHLHYEIWKDGRLENPALYMDLQSLGDGRD
jgi:murein DD-endopeptidase MepM/ murein hydrolase activator NlpD